MGKKILVALDDSENAMRAVEFVADSFTQNHEITLFSVVPDTAAICKLDSPELTPHFKTNQTAFCAMEDEKRDLIQASVDKAKEALVQSGFHEENISIKLETTKNGISRDIITEAKSGYDTVVMGRRGMSGIKEFFMGSVSQKVLHSLKDMTVLLVG
jgi:nucleotide-binding universal stress UspA family protein